MKCPENNKKFECPYLDELENGRCGIRSCPDHSSYPINNNLIIKKRKGENNK